MTTDVVNIEEKWPAWSCPDWDVDILIWPSVLFLASQLISTQLLFSADVGGS